MYKALAGILLLAVPASLPAQQDVDTRYPLRLHILAADKTFPTARMQPNWCSGSLPALGGVDAGSASGTTSASPCTSGGSSLAFGGPDDFSGAGRADLVTPPSGTEALSFTYEGCPRVRVQSGFTALPARWKKPGKLEVLLPTDADCGQRESLADPALHPGSHNPRIRLSAPAQWSDRERVPGGVRAQAGVACFPERRPGGVATEGPHNGFGEAARSRSATLNVVQKTAAASVFYGWGGGFRDGSS